MTTDVLDRVFTELFENDKVVQNGRHCKSMNQSQSVPLTKGNSRENGKHLKLASLQCAFLQDKNHNGADKPSSWRTGLTMGAGILLCLFFTARAYFGWATETTPVLPSPNQSTANTKPIEKIQLGERVLGHNPLRNEVDANIPDPDPKIWRMLKLEMAKPDGKTLRMELLRPLAWINQSKAIVGGNIFLNMPEMNAVGLAKVVFIGPCPSIQLPPGEVVIGRFVHFSNGNLLQLKLNGQAETIKVTAKHPYWSVDRNRFVAVEELHNGETVNTLYGPTQVVSITLSAKDEPVYNLEVHREHVYRVGSMGTLVHNSSSHAPGEVPQSRTLPGTPRTRQAIADTIQDVRGGQAGDVSRGTFRNIGQGEGGQPLLPTEVPPGGQIPVYEEYAVVSGNLRTGRPVPSGHLGDRRIIYDRANDRIYYTSNIHQKTPTFIELVDQ